MPDNDITVTRLRARVLTGRAVSRAPTAVDASTLRAVADRCRVTHCATQPSSCPARTSRSASPIRRPRASPPARRCSAPCTPRCAAPTSTSITESSTSRSRSFPATSPSASSRRQAAASRDIEGDAIKEGDVVTFLDVHETCNNCYYCLVARQPTKCPRRKVYGITYSANDGLLGGWAEAIWMKPGVKLIKLPQELDARDVHRRRVRAR